MALSSNLQLLMPQMLAVSQLSTPCQRLPHAAMRRGRRVPSCEHVLTSMDSLFRNVIFRHLYLFLIRFPQAGVKNGMFFGQARQICPELIPIPYDYDGYKRVSRALYDTVAR